MTGNALPIGRLISTPAGLRVARERAIRGPRRPREAAGVWARVEARAARRPDAIAVRSTGADVTYAELAGLVRREQRRLVGHGVAPGDPVAVTGPRGADVIAAFHNAYGASECSDDVALGLVTGSDAPALGTPLPNVVLHVRFCRRKAFAGDPTRPR